MTPIEPIILTVRPLSDLKVSEAKPILMAICRQNGLKYNNAADYCRAVEIMKKSINQN